MNIEFRPQKVRIIIDSGYYFDLTNSPRVISLSVVRDVDTPSDTDTTWIMQFAQFVDHGNPKQVAR